MEKLDLLKQRVGGIKENSRRGKHKYDIFDILEVVL
jgi:hypothetical protein